MNNHSLLLALGSVDDKYIVEASLSHNKHSIRKHPVPKRLIAACLLCVFVIAAAVFPQIFKSRTHALNTILKENGFLSSNKIFDHSLSPADSSDDKEMPPDLGEGSDGYSRTVILKAPSTDIHFIEYPDFSQGDKVAVYKTVTPPITGESVKVRHNALIAALGLTEASRLNTAFSTGSEDYLITEIPYTDFPTSDSIITIRTESRFTHVNYTISGLTDNLENPDYIAELINDPYVKSAYEHIGITNPAYSYAIEYNVTGIPSLYCMIYDNSGDPSECAVRARQKSVIISTWYTDDVTLTVCNSDTLQFYGYYDAIGIEEATQICIDRYNINNDDIVYVGFDSCHILDKSGRFAPCYVFYIRYDGEYIPYYNMDASVFQEYLVVNVPAVK